MLWNQQLIQKITSKLVWVPRQLWTTTTTTCGIVLNDNFTNQKQLTAHKRCECITVIWMLLNPPKSELTSGKRNTWFKLLHEMGWRGRSAIFVSIVQETEASEKSRVKDNPHLDCSPFSRFKKLSSFLHEIIRIRPPHEERRSTRETPAKRFTVFQVSTKGVTGHRVSSSAWNRQIRVHFVRFKCSSRTVLHV
jgi:hypothetical protein